MDPQVAETLRKSRLLLENVKKQQDLYKTHQTLAKSGYHGYGYGLHHSRFGGYGFPYGFGHLPAFRHGLPLPLPVGHGLPLPLPVAHGPSSFGYGHLLGGLERSLVHGGGHGKGEFGQGVSRGTGFGSHTSVQDILRKSGVF